MSNTTILIAYFPKEVIDSVSTNSQSHGDSRRVLDYSPTRAGHPYLEINSRYFAKRCGPLSALKTGTN